MIITDTQNLHDYQSSQIESMATAAAEKDAVLSAKLGEHTSVLQERDALDQQLREVLQELDLAQRTIIEQVDLQFSTSLIGSLY